MLTTDTETQKQAETTAKELLELEASLQRLERVLDSLWETTHPGQEMADDLEPEEVGRQILEAWAELGREQLERDGMVNVTEPAVQDLREELESVTAERDAIAKIAMERGEELRARGPDLRTVTAAFEQLAVLLWDEAERPDLGAPFSVLFERLLGRVCGLVEQARGAEQAEDEVATLRDLGAGAVPVKRLEALLEAWETRRNAPEVGAEAVKTLLACAGELAVVILEQRLLEQEEAP